MTDNLPIKFTVNGEDHVVLECDDTDPRASELGCHDWTEEDWLKALQKGLEEAQGQDEEALEVSE